MSTCDNALNSSKDPKTHTKKSSTPRILAILYDWAKSLNLKLTPTNQIQNQETNLVMLDEHERQLSIASFEFPKLFRVAEFNVP